MNNLFKPIAALVLVAGCGSSSNPKKADAAIDSKPIDAKPIDAPAPMLTVKNYLAWCSVAVGSNAASSAASQSVPITAAGTITLVATPASASFEVGGNMWHLTDGDTGSGETGTVSGMMSTAHVTVTATASKCVWVCCPFTNGTGCTGLANQCP